MQMEADENHKTDAWVRRVPICSHRYDHSEAGSRGSVVAKVNQTVKQLGASCLLSLGEKRTGSSFHSSIGGSLRILAKNLDSVRFVS